MKQTWEESSVKLKTGAWNSAFHLSTSKAYLSLYIDSKIQRHSKFDSIWPEGRHRRSKHNPPFLQQKRRGEDSVEIVPGSSTASDLQRFIPPWLQHSTSFAPSPDERGDSDSWMKFLFYFYKQSIILNVVVVLNLSWDHIRNGLRTQPLLILFPQS